MAEPASFTITGGQPNFDPEWLPPAAADRLRALRQRAADGHALIPPFEDVRASSIAKIEAANALARLTDHAQNHGFGMRPDDPRVIAEQRVLDKATREFELIKQRSEDRAAAWQATSGPLANAEAWLRDGRPHGTVLEDFTGPKPTLSKGEDLLSAIERLRRRSRELKADLHRIASAPYPSSHAKARTRAMIEQLAQRGTPDVSSLIELDRDIIWPMIHQQAEVVGGDQRALAFHETVDVVGLFAWLHRDQLIAALDREVSTEADDKSAMSHEARAKAEAETLSDLIDIERQESFFVFAAQGQGLPCEHRADCSPLALLGLRLVTVPRADAAPETTAGYSWPIRR